MTCQHPRVRMIVGGAIECLDCPGKFAKLADLPPLANPAAPTRDAASVTGRAEITPKGRKLLRGET